MSKRIARAPRSPASFACPKQQKLQWTFCTVTCVHSCHWVRVCLLGSSQEKEAPAWTEETFPPWLLSLCWAAVPALARALRSRMVSAESCGGELLGSHAITATHKPNHSPAVRRPGAPLLQSWICWGGTCSPTSPADLHGQQKRPHVPPVTWQQQGCHSCPLLSLAPPAHRGEAQVEPELQGCSRISSAMAFPAGGTAQRPTQPSTHATLVR